MAQYSHLSIYNKAFAVLREFYERTPRFAKQYKYILGGELIKYAVEIIKIIIKANNERDVERRKAMLENLCLTTEMLITQLCEAKEEGLGDNYYDIVKPYKCSACDFVALSGKRVKRYF